MQPGMICSGLYKDCLQILDHLKESSPTVILMDIDMPGISGIEAVKLVRSKYRDVFILMQTVFEDDEKIFASILAGADGYFLKKTHSTKLMGIREVTEGGAPMTASMAKRVLKVFQSKGTSNSSSEVFELNEQERSILSRLVNGLSYKMIADTMGISYYTVNMYIKRIYKKLHVHSATEAISKVTQHKIL